MNNESASILPLAVAFLCSALALTLVRTVFPDAVQSGVGQYVGLLPIVAIVIKLQLKGIRCPRTVLAAALVGIGVIGSIPLVRQLRAQLAPPPLVVARFDGDLLGSATARFSEQLNYQLERHQLPRTTWALLSAAAARTLEGDMQSAASVIPKSADAQPLVVVRGTERRLRIVMPPARPVLLPSLAHPSLAPIFPPLKLWGGGVSFGVSVDQLGATAEFLTLLVDGMSTPGELGELSLVDAGKLGGLWTSVIHRAVPLLLVSERLIARAISGEEVQEAYLSCASRHLSRAISLGNFSRDPELQAALYTDYGVVLWLRWAFFGDKAARKRAIVLWRAVSSSPVLNKGAKEAANANIELASRSSIPKKKGADRRKSTKHNREPID